MSSMPRVAPIVTVSDEDRIVLLQWSRGRRTPARLVQRAKIVLGGGGTASGATDTASRVCLRGGATGSRVVRLGVFGPFVRAARMLAASDGGGGTASSVATATLMWVLRLAYIDCVRAVCSVSHREYS